MVVYIKTGDFVEAQQYAELWNSVAEKLMNCAKGFKRHCNLGVLDIRL